MHAQIQEVPRLWILIALSALAVLPINMFVPSLPSIARDLEAEFVLVNVAIAGYAVATAVTVRLANATQPRITTAPSAGFLVRVAISPPLPVRPVVTTLPLLSQVSAAHMPCCRVEQKIGIRTFLQRNSHDPGRSLTGCCER